MTRFGWLAQRNVFYIFRCRLKKWQRSMNHLVIEHGHKSTSRMHRGHGWNCAGYIKEVLTALSTGAEEGAALYATEAMAAWEAPCEIRRYNIPRDCGQ